MPKSFREAVRNSSQRANIPSIDGFGTSRDEVSVEETLNAVEQVIGTFIKKWHQRLADLDAIVTGRIANITIQRTDTGLIVLAPAHLEYVDKGVNGARVQFYNTPYKYTNKRPPIEEIRRWAERRGIEEGAEWAIQESIFQEGKAPRNIYSNDLDALKKACIEVAAEEFKNEIIKNLYG